MKRIIVMLGIFIFCGWLNPDFSDVSLTFADGTWISEEVNDLHLRTPAPFAGSLYCNHQLQQHFNQDDFISENQDYLLTIKITHPGWYTVYDDQGRFLAEAVVVDKDVMTGFHTPVIKSQEQSFLLHQEGEVFWLAKGETQAFKGLPTRQIGQWEIYIEQIDKEGTTAVTVNEKTYSFVLDRTAPKLKIALDDQVLTPAENQTLFYNGTGLLQIYREDETDDIFEPEAPWQKEGQGYVREIMLKNGAHQIDEILCDQAGNRGQAAFTIVLDHEAPRVEMPESDVISQGEILLEDDFLDWENTAVLLDGRSLKEQAKPTENGYCLKIEKSGTYLIEALDYAGNKTTVSQTLTLDLDAPQVSTAFDDRTVSLLIEEEHLAGYDISLFCDGQAIPFWQTGQKLTAEVTKDGLYSWQGSIEDAAHHRTEVDLKQTIDIHAPIIDCDDFEQPFYDAPLEVSFSFTDMYLKSWTVDLYRNEVLVNHQEGQSSEQIRLLLDDGAYLDGRGLYRAEAYAADGLHETTLEKTWLMDTGCAPIVMTINKANAEAVESVKLLQPTEIAASCSEGEASWQLFKNEQCLGTGTGLLIVDPKQQATHLVWQAEDEFGHQSKKTLFFKYPSLPADLQFFDGSTPLKNASWQMTKNELVAKSEQNGRAEVYMDGQKVFEQEDTKEVRLPIEDGRSHQITVLFKGADGLESVRSLQVTGAKSKQEKNRFLWIGGGLCAAALVFGYIALRFRAGRKDKYLLAAETTALTGDHQDTERLS